MISEKNAVKAEMLSRLLELKDYPAVKELIRGELAPDVAEIL